MSGPSLRCVVDASVAIKLFVSEPGSLEAESLFAHLAALPAGELYVPDLFYIECANILWKYVRTAHYSADTAQQDLADLRQFALRAIPLVDLVEDALRIAVAFRITAYDASYVALSGRENVPLVTADEKLVLAMVGSQYTVHLLNSFAIPALPEPS